MRFGRRITALITTAALLLTLVFQITGTGPRRVSAESGNLLVDIALGTGGRPLLARDSATLTWEKVSDVTSYVFSYYDQDGVLHTETITPGADSFINKEVTGLKPDFIYQFKVEAYKGLTLYQTFVKKVITGVSMEVTRVEEAPVSLPGGGKESGGNPELKFKLKIPSIWDGTAVSLYTAYDRVDYDIYMGTDSDGMNRTQMKVRYSETAGRYIVTRYKDNYIKTVSENVYTNDAAMESGYIVFFCKGGSDNARVTTNDNYPASGAASGFDSDNINDFNSPTLHTPVDLRDIYKNPDITPGTVLRMSVEPFFNDDTGNNSVAALRTGVSGGYTYTSIRYQIAKDSSNNLMVTVFKINQEGKSKNDMVTFTYEVQYDTKPTFMNFTTSSRQKDDYADESGKMEIYIENKDYDTTFYYRVVAWSPNESEKLLSYTIDYTLALDISLPPVPESVIAVSTTPEAGTVTNTFFGTPPSGTFDVKSSKVKVRWKKPSNYAEIIENNSGANTLYYHFWLSTSQNDVDNFNERVDNIFGDPSNSKEYDGIKYREIFTVNIAALKVVNENGVEEENGGWLEYTMDGLKLFSTVESLQGDPVQNLANDDGYPTYLLPNKVYYLKLSSSKNGNTSDSSVPVSFTTNLSIKKDPPSAVNFVPVKNEIANGHNSISLEWNKISFNIEDYTLDTGAEGNVYYDLYMSDSPEEASFMRIATTEVSNGDVAFNGLGIASGIINATISDFNDVALQQRFGDRLKPNFTYYFTLQTRVEITGEAEPRISPSSRILAITTLKGDITAPGDNERLPRLPEDYAIDTDNAGNQMVDSSTAVMTWKEVETDVGYTLIRTSKKIDPDATLSQIAANPESKYKQYLSSEEAVPGNPAFPYDSGTGIMKYKANDLSPNTVYYFSLRTERVSGSETLVSPWITVPVTTTLIEAPTELSVVSGYEIGVSWDASSIFTSGDFSITISEHNAYNFRLLEKGTVFISEQPLTQLQSRFYARIVSLDPDKQYDVYVTGSTYDGNGSRVSYSRYISYDEIDGVTLSRRTETRDPMHELDIRWKGKDNYKFELAIKAESDTDYRIITELSGFEYMSKEKPSDMVMSDETMYYARIYGLKSDTKYSIKVRSVKLSDATNMNEYSKYAGPVGSRTEFSQQDHDRDEQQDDEKESYFDRVAKFKDNLFWVVKDTTSAYEIKFRGDRTESYIRSSGENALTIDLSLPSGNDYAVRGVYLPVSAVELLSGKNMSIVLKTPVSEYTIRPDSLMLRNTADTSPVWSKSDVVDGYLHIIVQNRSSNGLSLPDKMTSASGIDNMAFQLMGSRYTDEAIEKRIKDTVDSYIANGLSYLQNSVSGSLKDTPEELNSIINTIIDNMGNYLESYLTTYMQVSSSTDRFGSISTSIQSLSVPMSGKLYAKKSDKGIKTVYALVNGLWRNIGGSPSSDGSMVAFETMKPGDFVIANRGTDSIIIVPSQHWAADDIGLFLTKYDLSGVFSAQSGKDADKPATVLEVFSLLEKVLSYRGEKTITSSLPEKARELGFADTINFAVPDREIARQEMALLVMRLHEIKTGVAVEEMLPGRLPSMSDEADTGRQYFSAVQKCVSLGIMELDGSKKFRPAQQCTRAEAISALTRLLKLLGEI